MAQLFRNVKDLVEERIKISAIILWENYSFVGRQAPLFFGSISFYKSLVCVVIREKMPRKKRIVHLQVA